METRYPIRNANGKDFDRQEDILTLLRQEKHGRWLSGSNDMWHGGIHISRNTVPWSVLTPDTGDGAVPLQCIASGELVAWRVCQDYVMGNLGDKPLQYSPSFLLVRSVHKPTKDSSTWLCFYTLYMHLAPLSCYPKWTVYQVTPRGNGLIMRQYSGSEVSGQKAPPEVSHKARLHSGEQVLIERQETFLLHNGQAEVFGLAQRLKGGAPVGDKFWTSARPEYVAPVGEQYSYLPGWMSAALKAGQFDTVVCPKVMTAIRAGDAIGFLGKEEVPDEFSNVTADWFSHIEVLSNDGRMPLFLNNPAQLHTGRQFLLVPEGKQLYQREEKGSSYSFEPVDLTNRGDAADIIPAESATSATDSASVAYLQIRPGTWIRKDDVETVSQNDLTKLKFKAIGQEPAKNQLRSLEQQWVIDAFRWLSSQIWAGRDMESGQLQAYYTRMADELEKVNTPENIQNENRDSVSDMLRHRNLYVDFLLRRLVVKHESEWHGGSTNPKWNGVLATMSGDSLAYVQQWLDAHEWMSQVPEFSKDEAVWHFHPVEFLAVIGGAKRGWAHSAFANLICNAESRNDYTAYNQTYPHPHPTQTEVHRNTNLTSMTLQQVIDAQGVNQMFATGRYQITPPGLNEAIRVLHLDMNSLYDEAMQDRIFNEYIIKVKRPAIIAYLEGDGSVDEAAYACAMEFASVGVKQGKKISPDPHEFEKNPDGSFVRDKHHNLVHKKRYANVDGIGYYNGDKLNKVFIMPDDLIQKLKDSKNEAQ
ncbi:hypothetical protein DEO48_24755 [Enterobacter sp. CGMCC 5087]|uniref:hypothetical protein n=1 Tax=Enterobacter sp. CGMCC 5087 TaxID=2183878 RepID=UPI000D685294|nr:hypothetical protein [Enterobacter sp. CGMCC 5087]PWI77368.1 hypothetical protein DEO48_24755 [Enterobacter sp. CGMCC 5087]